MDESTRLGASGRFLAALLAELAFSLHLSLAERHGLRQGRDRFGHQVDHPAFDDRVPERTTVDTREPVEVTEDRIDERRVWLGRSYLREFDRLRLRGLRDDVVAGDGAVDIVRGWLGLPSGYGFVDGIIPDCELITIGNA